MNIVNKVKSLGARATMGDTDVRALLEKDHDEARALAQQMCDASGMRRMALLGRLKPILTAHSRAEERAVYDALLQVREDESPRTIAQEGYVEHTLVDELLAKLAALNPATDVWHAHAQVLKELLEHHIDEEQTDTFAELGDHFSRDELVAMGDRFQREKAAILGGTESPRQRSVAARVPAARKATPRKTTATKAAKRAPARRASGAKTRSRTTASARKSARSKR